MESHYRRQEDRIKAGPPRSAGCPDLARQSEFQIPAEVYTRSSRVYRGLDDLTYPFHDQTIAVTRCGCHLSKRRKVNLSHVFAGHNVGVMQVGERNWLLLHAVRFGYFDDETCRLEPIENPFGPKVLSMSPE
jgi:putative transposase